MARYEEDGKEVLAPNYPYMLRFKPTKDLPKTSKGRFYE